MGFKFSGSGVPTTLGVDLSIVPDGTSTSVTFDVTKIPFYLGFTDENVPPIAVGNVPSFISTATVNGNANQPVQYTCTYSWNTSTFQVTVTFTPLLTGGYGQYANTPAAIPSDTSVPLLSIGFLYESL